MTVLFLTMDDFNDISERGTYSDLMREFLHNGHCVYAVSPTNSNDKTKDYAIRGPDYMIIRTGSAGRGGRGLIKKGLSLLAYPGKTKKALKKYTSKVRFDAVIYATPPITCIPAVRYIKKRDGAAGYLLLKDIYPQNAVDLGCSHAKACFTCISARKKRPYTGIPTT
jgi:hypothetical protein